jgi:ubiquinone/menaquinone biosynthesis C-methylase UbiE
MTIRLDPDEHEIEALFRLSGGFEGKSVLEVGCGDGRLTWRFADQAGHVTGIDPSAEKIARARQNIPAGLAPRLSFYAQSLEDFIGGQPAAGPFDRALLSWSL